MVKNLEVLGEDLLACEDRNYECCEAMPPKPFAASEQYAEWYDAHVLAYNQKSATTTQVALHQSTDFRIEEDI